MQEKRKKVLLYIAIPLLIVVVTAALLHSHLKKINDSPVMPNAPWALTTDVVTLGSEDSGFPALGKVQSATVVRIIPQISGSVLKTGPRNGGMVNKGDLIVLLDTRELGAEAESLKARISSAEAEENNAHKELQREQDLFKEGGSSKSSVEHYTTTFQSSQASVRSLKEQLESLQVKISYGTIKAPISGRVAERLVEPGDTAFAGKPVYSLTAENGGRVIVPIPPDTVALISAGSKVELSLGHQRQVVFVTRINPSLDALSMGSLEIDLPQRPFNLPNDGPVAARVITKHVGPGLSVSIKALRPASESGKRTLFRVIQDDPPHIQQTAVQIQLCGEDRCIITGDLKEGDRVVTAHGSVLLQLHDKDQILDSWSTAERQKP